MARNSPSANTSRKVADRSGVGMRRADGAPGDGGSAEAGAARAAVSDNGTSQLRTVALRTPLVTWWRAKAPFATKSGNLVTADDRPGDLSDARAAALAGTMGGGSARSTGSFFLARGAGGPGGGRGPGGGGFFSLGG